MGTHSKPHDWVTVDRFYHPTEAHIAAGRLEAEGVPVFLLGINHASTNWLITTALGGIQVQVPAANADAARKILAEIDAAARDEPMTCPACASSRTTAPDGSWRISFLTLHLFSIPLPWRQEKRRCLDCGAEW
jgi:hypothetical protein